MRQLIQILERHGEALPLRGEMAGLAMCVGSLRLADEARMLFQLVGRLPSAKPFLDSVLWVQSARITPQMVVAASDSVQGDELAEKGFLRAFGLLGTERTAAAWRHRDERDERRYQHVRITKQRVLAALKRGDTKAACGALSLLAYSERFSLRDAERIIKRAGSWPNDGSAIMRPAIHRVVTTHRDDAISFLESVLDPSRGYSRNARVVAQLEYQDLIRGSRRAIAEQELGLPFQREPSMRV